MILKSSPRMCLLERVQRSSKALCGWRPDLPSQDLSVSTWGRSGAGGPSPVIRRRGTRRDNLCLESEH